MHEFMQDVTTVPQTRWRSILYEHRPETQAFLSHIQTYTSSLIDVCLCNPNSHGETVTLYLSPEGPYLRHVQAWGVSLPWQSPRLANLVTLDLAGIYYRIPESGHLHTILSSSPRLERLSVRNPTAGDMEPRESVPTSSPPIILPILTVLVFINISSAITRGIIPLICATSCKTVVVTGEGDLSFQLQPQETTLEFLALPITVSESLKLKVKMDGELCVHFQSETNIPNRWVYWADDKPGVDVRVAVHSADGLARMWDQLDMVWRSRGKAANIQTLEIAYSPDVSGQELPFPIGILGFCPELVTLWCVDDRGAALRPLVRRLQRKEENKEGVRGGTSTWLLPKLNHLGYHANTLMDVEECAADLKTFLELRYARLAEDRTVQPLEDPTPMQKLDLPSQLFAKLKSMNISTYLKFEDVIQSSG